jgi:hypothetical protein
VVSQSKKRAYSYTLEPRDDPCASLSSIGSGSYSVSPAGSASMGDGSMLSGAPGFAAPAALAAVLLDARVSALTITELNPDHGAEDGSALRPSSTGSSPPSRGCQRWSDTFSCTSAPAANSTPNSPSTPEGRETV